MILDLRELIAGTVKAVPFEYDCPGEGLTEDLCSGSVHAEGRVENHAGYLVLNGEAVLSGVFRCARCCKEFEQDLRFPMEYKLAESLVGDDEEEEFLLLSDGMLDIAETVREQLLTEMPIRFLCRSNCKGLCPKCGCDLNVERCSCDTKEIDPRWAALAGYFDNE